MTTSLILSFVWALVANMAAMFPSRHSHWPTAYVLIALGVPLLVWVFVQNGVLIGIAVLLAGASVLRWPLRYLWRWVRQITGRTA